MQAAVYRGPGDVRIESLPDPEIEESTDAVVRVTHTAICGSDLWFYRGETDYEEGAPVGHEPMGIVEEVGDDVRSVEPGDRVLAPFSISCGHCEFCRKGLHTSCVNGGGWGGDESGAQGERIRTPHADGTLVRVPDRYADDEDVLESLLPLTDVLSTGHHAAVSAGVGPGDTAVVVGDGAVGLCGVLAANRLGAERVIAMGHHEDRLDIAREFGATDVVSARGDEAAEEARDLTHGGANHVLECVGAESSMGTAADVARPGGTVGYVGVPAGVETTGFLGTMFGKNVSLEGGVAPVRAYVDDLMADVLQGTLDPSPIFTKTVDLDGVPEGYEAMDEREAVKVMVRIDA
ncbi:zinc-dependent alcohol dehydrogenase family protein [Candidatus Halobonum tyrrellensis]|uniref:Oxidoreductase ( zinc-containing alcohol dehydrogenase) n=1 Tax=Candidatus Halobonum tyrrellensis G22 TaxID=1324957 RepID=V4H8I1_9EURY|nr:zinc-dependent alcohol dehydrogenase family protein [Candidatus Halobonum tyrrellensis]ESP87020.1 oxidoreductase (zinc-containing alcohol dehydrogenase) [Candidatus Halobonum tyrrellensis G22]